MACGAGCCLALATVLVILAMLLADTFVVGFGFLPAVFGPPAVLLAEAGFWPAVLPLVGPCLRVVLATLEGCAAFTVGWLFGTGSGF